MFQVSCTDEFKAEKKKKKTYIIIINKVNVHYRRVKNEGFLVKRKKKKNGIKTCVLGEP